MENTRDETKASHHRSHGAVKKPGSVSVDSKEKNMRKQEQIGEEKYDTTSCISASQILWSTGMLSGPIPNGFYSVVPDKKLKELYKDIPTIEDLHDLEANGLKVDVIFVDAEKDKKLSKLKDYIGALVVGSNTTPAAAIKKISGLVSDVYKRQNLGLSPKKASPRASMHSSVSGGVQLLGKIKYGSCRPRALLFKVLADAVGFESRLLVGSPAEGYSECVGSCSHMSVIVVLNSAEFLVDLMRSPGQLVPIASKAIFTTHISAAGGSDSTENDSSDSPIGPESPLYGVSRRVEAQRSEKEDGPLLHRQGPSSNAAGPPMRNTMLRSSSIDRKFRMRGGTISVDMTLLYSLSQGQQKVIASRGTASSRSEDTPSQMHRLRRRSMSMTTEISDEIVRYMRAMNVSLKPNRLPQEHEEGGSESTSSNVSSVVLDNESGDMSSLYATQRKHISQKSEALHLSPQGVDEVVSMWNRVMSLPIFQDKPMLPFDEWNIDFSELTFGTRVGIGFFGEVFRGVWNGMEVAVKVFLEQDLTAENMEDFCNEISILSRLRHPNVILFLGACLMPPRLSLITEYMDFGSLFNLIHTSGQNHTISWSRRLKMLRDICRGLMYIHRMKIIHRDLKSANCLVSKHWTVKICDFGLSKLMTDSPITTLSASGTPEWMAPEVIRCEPFTEKCDIYSFGVIVWELYTLHKPWEGVATTRVIHNVANEGLRLEIPSGPVGRIIADCLAEPEARPNCEEILTRLLDNDLFLL